MGQPVKDRFGRSFMSMGQDRKTVKDRFFKDRKDRKDRFAKTTKDRKDRQDRK